MTEHRGPDLDRTNDIVVETERLVLDLPRPGDAEVLFELVGGEHRRTICQYLLWDGPDTVDDITRYHGESAGRPFRDGGFSWIIRDRVGDLADPGAALGAIGIEHSGPAGRAGVGYWLGVQYWRKGVMKEALRPIIDIGFDELGFNKIEAEIFAHNTASRALVESLGFQLEGVIRDSQWKYETWVDDAVYGLLRDERH